MSSENSILNIKKLDKSFEANLDEEKNILINLINETIENLQKQLGKESSSAKLKQLQSDILTLKLKINARKKEGKATAEQEKELKNKEQEKNREYTQISNNTLYLSKQIDKLKKQKFELKVKAQIKAHIDNLKKYVEPSLWHKNPEATIGKLQHENKIFIDNLKKELGDNAQTQQALQDSQKRLDIKVTQPSMNHIIYKNAEYGKELAEKKDTKSQKKASEISSLVNELGEKTSKFYRQKEFNETSVTTYFDRFNAKVDSAQEILNQPRTWWKTILNIGTKVLSVFGIAVLSEELKAWRESKEKEKDNPTMKSSTPFWKYDTTSWKNAKKAKTTATQVQNTIGLKAG